MCLLLVCTCRFLPRLYSADRLSRSSPSLHSHSRAPSYLHRYRYAPRIFFAGEAALTVDLNPRGHAREVQEFGTMRSAMLSAVHEAARLTGAQAVYFNSLLDGNRTPEYPPLFNRTASRLPPLQPLQPLQPPAAAAA